MVNFADGVDPVYLQLLHEARRKSAQSYATAHSHGPCGIVIGPTEGDFARHTLRAMRNAQRIRNILKLSSNVSTTTTTSSSKNDSSIKLALMTCQEHLDMIQDACGGMAPNKSKNKPIAKTKIPNHLVQETCRLWANNTLFDDVVETSRNNAKDDENGHWEFQPNDNHTELQQGSSVYWLKALGGYRYAPYTASLFLDSDAFPCPGVQDLFDIINPPRGAHNPWQLAVATGQKIDVSMGMDQYSVGWHKQEEFWTPGNVTLLRDFPHFAMRNSGTVLFHFHRRLVQTLAEFIPLVAEHVYNHVATPQRKVINDQYPLRIALYLFHRLHSNPSAVDNDQKFNEQPIPLHTSCRSYPGNPYAGTDGFLNGQFPIQQDGKHCHECHCTPCRVVHTATTHFVTINGMTGWEEDFLDKYYYYNHQNNVHSGQQD